MTDKNNSGVVCLVCVGVIGAIVLLSINPIFFILALIIVFILYIFSKNNRNTDQRRTIQSSPINVKTTNRSQVKYNKISLNSNYDYKKEETTRNEINKLIQSEHYKYIEEFAVEHLKGSYTYQDVLLLKEKLSRKGFNIQHDDLIRIINEEIKYQKYGTY
jgi:hypothetical protein